MPPTSSFADHQPATRPQHARHSRDRLLGVLNAKQTTLTATTRSKGTRERQSLGSPSAEHRCWRAAPSCGRDRRGIRIEPCHDGAAPNQPDANPPPANVQQMFAGRGEDR
jgi:hypothetical protein